MTARSHEQTKPPTPVAFLYLDEKYLDAGAMDEMQVTSLGGLLVTSEQYPAFRDRLFELLPSFEQGHDAFETEVHASNLFPGLSDKERFEFLEGLVALVNDMRCRVIRRGSNLVPGNDTFRKHERSWLFFCFRSVLMAIRDSDIDAQVWPVVEIDHSEIQDHNFGKFVRWMCHATASLNFTGEGVKELIDDDKMVDTQGLGDLLYVSKQSIIGSAADCLLYLIHCKWLSENGFTLSEYKTTLANIASKLDSKLVDDVVVPYR